ncbi:MAG: hypothetical protein U0269_02115 [Polyangiales bacterium]
MSVRARVVRATGSLDAGATTRDSFELTDARARIPGTFTVTPANDRTASALVEINADVGPGASAREPPLRIRRLVRFGFVQGRTQQVRVLLSLRCGERSRGCAQVADDACTVQQVCEEMGQTCGERGRCVPVDQTPEDLADASTSDAGDASTLTLGPTANALEAVTSSNAYALATDPIDDSIALAASFSGAGTFLGRVITSTGQGALVARVESNLSVRWLRVYGAGTTMITGRAIASSSDSVWSGGYYHANAPWMLDVHSFAASSVRQRAVICRFNDGDGTANSCLDFGSSAANAQLYRASVLGDTAAFGGVINGTWELDPMGGAGNGDDGSVIVMRGDRVAWVRRMLDDAGPGATVTGIAVDSDGAVFAAGSFAGTLRAGASPMTVRSAGMLDAFVARFSREGALEWIRSFGSATSDDAINDLALTASGILFAVGSIGNNASGVNEVPSFAMGAGARDAMLVTLDGASGTVAFARRFATPEDDTADRVAIVSDGTLLIGGSFGSSGLAPMPAYSLPIRTGMAVLNVERDGTLRWARPLYVAGAAQFAGVGALNRSRRVAMTATITMDAGQGAPSWAPSLTIVPRQSTAVLATFSMRDVLVVPR